MTEAGYSDTEIPGWLKRPTPEQIAARASESFESTESTEPKRSPPSLVPKEALSLVKGSQVSAPGSNASNDPNASNDIPASLTEEQVRLLGQAGISFFNNSACVLHIGHIARADSVRFS